ncbi:MAG TPA: DUF1501 domain-containing protein [Gemmataceae bacterium]|nr:DUF1501 domain-containing protein [Gemmataceae bacterium]
MNHTRRHFLTRTTAGLGMAAVASLLDAQDPVPGELGRTHIPASAKNVIFLFMGGGPSHVDTFDPKPMLRRQHGVEMPASVLGTQRVTLMTRNQGHFKAASTPFRFRKVGRAGHDMSDLWVHLPTVADELTFIRSMHTEPINHDPAVTLMQTGRPDSGLPCVGSWCSYGLGSENRDLPAFIFMMSGTLDQPITTRYFTNGFLPAQHQGVQFFPASDPVQYLTNPPGIDNAARGDIVSGINDLNRLRRAKVGDPEIDARIHAFELAFRMQTSAPDLMNVADESERTFELYGPDSRNPTTFARQCLLARRLVERGVRFVQLFHRGWDAHNDVIGGTRRQVRDVDQPIAGLIRDLKSRGLLDSTLIVWTGEFGRTAYGQGDLSGAFGRDHHPRCFTSFLAGGGIKPGVVLGSTDEFGYNLVERPVHVNDLHATMLHCLGIDHLRFTFRHGGREFRLTDVAGDVVREVLV